MTPSPRLGIERYLNRAAEIAYGVSRYRFKRFQRLIQAMNPGVARAAVFFLGD